MTLARYLDIDNDVRRVEDDDDMERRANRTELSDYLAHYFEPGPALQTLIGNLGAEYTDYCKITADKATVQLVRS